MRTDTTNYSDAIAVLAALRQHPEVKRHWVRTGI